MDDKTKAVSEDLTPTQLKMYDGVRGRMALHREVLRGAKSEAPSSGIRCPSRSMATLETHGKSSSLRSLPTINFLDIDDDAYAESIVEEALPEDRARFRGYLSSRPLGLGMITAGASFGRTTAGAAATLALEAKVGKVLCSGPTNVAIDNFSHRLFGHSQAIVDRYNKGKDLSDYTRRCYKLIIRAYNVEHELAALTALLRDPNVGDKAAPTSVWKLPSKWKLPLSCAFWLLLDLGSPAAGWELHHDDPVYVRELHDRIAKGQEFAPLREVAKGTITWEQFGKTCSQKLYGDMIEGFQVSLVNNADLLCVTPSASDSIRDQMHLRMSLSRKQCTNRDIIRL
ncbi:DNA helicase [Fusarium longipes]|uniref:DNA helicase n=1 Tax=Fusarium longipes TaxID=694270 RepID=A0A395SLP0_9HYPO|nr:DNA helicase [Fusarium longipes]